MVGSADEIVERDAEVIGKADQLLQTGLSFARLVTADGVLIGVEVHGEFELRDPLRFTQFPQPHTLASPYEKRVILDFIIPRWYTLCVLLALTLLLTCLGACSDGDEQASAGVDAGDYDRDLDLDDPDEDEEEETDVSDAMEQLQQLQEQLEQATSALNQLPASSAAAESKQQSAGGLRSDFKAAMDSYEAFYDEYVAFMKKYNANPSDFSLLSKYTDMVKKELDMAKAFGKWKSEDLNDEEEQYYLAVQTRVTKKLLDAGLNG